MFRFMTARLTESKHKHKHNTNHNFEKRMVILEIRYNSRTYLWIVREECDINNIPIAIL